jgi:AhpD family alkylhydroperoxidase
MALVPLIDDDDAPADVRAVYDDIRATRKTDSVNHFSRALANDPRELARVWAHTRETMSAGALDVLTKELVYLAVSITNNCEYCIRSHRAAAVAKGMSAEMFMELAAVVALANANNRLANALQVDVDERYR